MTMAQKLVYGEVMAEGPLCLDGADLKELQRMIQPIYWLEYSPEATGNHAADAAMIELLRNERDNYRQDRLSLFHALRAAVGGFAENPGHSDLDDVQPITLHVTLGSWRKWKNIISRIERSV